MVKYSEVSHKLAQRVEEVCDHLIPGGTKKGKHYEASDCFGGKGQSLKVTLNGKYTGDWRDFATGDHGDLLDLWAASRDISLTEAYRQACDYLGIDHNRFASQAKEYKKPTCGVASSPETEVMSYLKSRGITEKTIAEFRVTSNGRLIQFNYFRDGELINRKTLPIKRDERGNKLPARFETGCEMTLYGWDTIDASARSVVLCEGEIDAMSLRQYGYAALSVPSGAGGTSWIENDFDRLSIFDTIYLCFDNDKSGQKGAVAHAQRLGLERCINVVLPLNDVNDCLTSGISKDEIDKCFANGTSFDPEQLRATGNYIDEIKAKLYPQDDEILGYDTPWKNFGDKIFFSKSGLSIWTGISGHGKTQFLNHLAVHWMHEGAKVCIASLEISPAETIQNLIPVMSCMNSCPRKPNIISEGYADACFEWLNDKVWFFDEFGGANGSELIQVLEYAHRKYGIDIFIIDSLSLINIDDDDYNKQSRFVRELVKFKKYNNCHVHLVVHPRKLQNEEDMPGKFDFKGSGTITNVADNCFSVWRHKAKELAVDMQNRGITLTQQEEDKLTMADCYVYCMKQRTDGFEGRFAFWLDKKSKQYGEYSSFRPKRYVEYSNAGGE